MKRLDRFYPPGYGWREELKAAAWLFFAGVVFSLQYLFELGNMVQGLYVYEGTVRFLRPGAAAESFVFLAQQGCQFFLASLLFQVWTVLSHYFSYWRRTKSIYVMRRLPRRGVVFLSCVQGPVLCLGFLMLALTVLYGMYLGLYFLTVPAECMPRLI